MKKTIIIAGSKGVMGSTVTDFFRKNYNVLELDLQLGHDLSDEKFVKEWFKKNKGDCLINLFALNDHVDKTRFKEKDTLYDISLDSFRKYLDVNLVALFSVCREFARNNKNGVIINFSSTYGLVSPIPQMYPGSEKHIAYGVSKAGVIQLTKHLAVHLAPNIRVNCIVPGGVKFKQTEEFQKAYASRTPLNRMMNAEEMTGILEYLCDDKSSYVTGSVFVIDGGWTAW